MGKAMLDWEGSCYCYYRYKTLAVAMIDWVGLEMAGSYYSCSSYRALHENLLHRFCYI
jgi:hypothetical protein